MLASIYEMVWHVHADLGRNYAQGECILSAISDFATKQNDFNARHGAAIEKIVVSVDGLTGDVKTLNDKITELQNNPGPISPQDQALLDEIVVLSGANVAKTEAVSVALEALDAQTPPTPPTS